MIFPAGQWEAYDTLEFTLNSHLRIENAGGEVRIKKAKTNGQTALDLYQIITPLPKEGELIIPIRYSGKIDAEIKTLDQC